MSQGEERDRRKYKIDIAAYGGLGIETPAEERVWGSFRKSLKPT